MSRPRKERKIFKCVLPKAFRPCGICCKEKTLLSRDEVEAIRLVDCHGNDQETAAKQMGISRTTLQRTYKSARSKIAHALVEGNQLILEKGGEQNDS